MIDRLADRYPGLSPIGESRLAASVLGLAQAFDVLGLNLSDPPCGAAFDLHCERSAAALIADDQAALAEFTRFDEVINPAGIMAILEKAMAMPVSTQPQGE